MGRRQRRTDQTNVHTSVTEVDSNCDETETQRVGVLSIHGNISRDNTVHVIPERYSATGSDRVEFLGKSQAFFSLLFSRPVHAEQHLHRVFWKSNTSASNHLMACAISRYDGKLSGKIGIRNTAPDTLQKRASHGSQIFRSHTGSRSRGSIRDCTGARPKHSGQCVRTQ